MAMPDFQSLMLPLMEFAADGQEHSLWEAREFLAKRLGVTEEERIELLLQQAGLLNSIRRGYFRITDRGGQVLGEKPDRIGIKLLDCFPEFVEFHRSSPRKKLPLKRPRSPRRK